MKIKIYIVKLSAGRLRIPTRGEHERYTSHGGMTAASEGIRVDDPEFMEDDCRKALDIVKKFCCAHDLKLKVYDIKEDRGAFRASFDRVRMVPTTIIGPTKIEGIPTLEDLESAAGF